MDNQKQFVGRAGTKLEHALKEFKVDVTGLICADFGSAIGGFVDCLLQNGANKIYAVETGYGVLDWKLRNDPRVVVMERTNAMHVELPEKVDIVTVDASWTRQATILPNAVKQLKPNGIVITLIKPHYEADKSLLTKGKLSDSDAESVTRGTLKNIEFMGLRVLRYCKSPITGGKGENIEYLALLKI